MCSDKYCCICCCSAVPAADNDDMPTLLMQCYLMWIEVILIKNILHWLTAACDMLDMLYFCRAANRKSKCTEQSSGRGDQKQTGSNISTSAAFCKWLHSRWPPVSEVLHVAFYTRTTHSVAFFCLCQGGYAIVTQLFIYSFICWFVSRIMQNITGRFGWNF